ncbi:MFS transporter [Pseudonocardia xinjiangensis]|uniref:MFS transporter n=1 Tax=Pseudonocardia xinjiangensis TaxID=75289 RepID=UPI003D93B610
MRRSWLAVAAAMFCCGWGGNQFTPLLVMYRESAGYSVLTVDEFLGAYVVGLAPALLVVGALSNRYGRRPLTVAAVIFSVLASGLLALGEAGPVPIFLGRFVTGVAVAIAMAVGTTWTKELSEPPFDTVAKPGAGARRPALALTLGFGLGAGVAGVLAQWGPWPMVTPYVVHVVLTATVIPLLLRCPETRPRAVGGVVGTGASRFSVPTARHPRFLRVVLPMAPWVFGAAGVAYATMPQVVGGRLGHWDLAYSTLLTVCTLGAGAAVQPIAKRLDRVTDARAVVISMIIMSCGLGISVVGAYLRSPWLALVAAVVLGCAYGIAVVSGLLEIQRITPAAELAGITGVYYALAYVGFLLPTVLAALSGLASYPVMLGALALIALTGTAVIASSTRAHLPVVVPATDAAETVPG